MVIDSGFFAVAHHIFGVPFTINSSNFVYFLGLEKFLLLNHPDVSNVFTGMYYMKNPRTSITWDAKFNNNIYQSMLIDIKCYLPS